MDWKRGNLVIRGVKASFKVAYEGRGVSTNSFYSGSNAAKGWGARMNLKAKYNKIFTTLLNESSIPWMDEYMVVLFYNSKQDPDNTVSTTKFFLDALKEERVGSTPVRKGWVYDDSPKYCKGVMSIPDKTLPHNTFEFNLLQLK